MPVVERTPDYPSSALLILDRIDIPHRRPRLGGHLRLVIHLLLQQRPRHGRVDGDVVLAVEDLVVTDDPEPELAPFLILDLHPGAEEHPALLLRQIGRASCRERVWSSPNTVS